MRTIINEKTGEWAVIDEDYGLNNCGWYSASVPELYADTCTLEMLIEHYKKEMDKKLNTKGYKMVKVEVKIVEE
jgi:hypothetical protein